MSIKVRKLDLNGNVIEEGTPLTQEVINNINWKDDKEVKFIQTDTSNVSVANGETKIATLPDGKTYLFVYGKEKMLLSGQFAEKSELPTFTVENGILKITDNK